MSEISPWSQVIEELAKAQLVHNHLKAAFLAQWILETGRGTSHALVEMLNVAGMKWRTEMEGFATKVWYATNTEPKREGPNGFENGDWFCKFESASKAVRGYFQFLSRAPYHGWEEHTVSAEDFLSFIGPTWCPVGYTPEYVKSHGGKTYHEYVLSLLPEATKLLADANAQAPQPATGAGVATWLEFNRGPQGEAVITAWAGNKPVGNTFGSPAITTTQLQAILKDNPSVSSLLVAETGKKLIPQIPSTDMPKSLPLVGFKFLLDPGHSSKQSGAFGKGSNPPSEYEMNVLQAKIISNELRNQGATVTIYDPAQDDLTAVAMQAQGKDGYIALHHNAANSDGIDEGTETHIYHQATKECEELANAINNAVASELKTKNRGVKRSGYTVLSVSTRNTNCTLNVLTESYFIDDYSSKTITTDRSTRAAYAIARAVIEFYKKKKRS